jgi:hypothetical protein
MRIKALVGLVTVFASGCMTFQTRYSLFDLPDNKASVNSTAGGTVLVATISAILAAACAWGFLKLQKPKHNLYDNVEPAEMADSLTVAGTTNHFTDQDVRTLSHV